MFHCITYFIKLNNNFQNNNNKKKHALRIVVTIQSCPYYLQLKRRNLHQRNYTNHPRSSQRNA